MINPGIYTTMTSEDYHADKDSISRSALMDFKKSPRTYWANYLNPDRPTKEAKAAWTFGSAFHTLILEPHLFEMIYFVLPERVYEKDVGREEYDRYKTIKEEAKTLNKTVLSLADYKRLCEMRTSLFANERARHIIEYGIYESSYIWEDEHSGLIVKSRPDILSAGMYIDLKTIDDASPNSFQKSMAQYGYHIQAAMVKDGVLNLTGEKLQSCINICVETKYPYSVGIYIIDEAAIEYGHWEYKQLLLDLKSAIVYNEFNDYEPQTISLPKWY